MRLLWHPVLTVGDTFFSVVLHKLRIKMGIPQNQVDVSELVVHKFGAQSKDVLVNFLKSFGLNGAFDVIIATIAVRHFD